MVKRQNNSLTLEQFLDKIKVVYQLFCFRKDGDMVIVISGPEGAGKSILALAISCFLDAVFSARHIYYNAETYVFANLGAIKSKLRDLDPAKVEKYNDIRAKLDIVHEESIDPTIKRGTVLLYDEAARGLFNRLSMTSGAIDQVLLFINNRFLNLCHILCIPDPSTLEKYIKKFRIKIFIWVEDIPDGKGNWNRTAFMWNRKSYLRMALRSDFEQLVMGGIKSMSKASWPNFMLQVPNLVEGDANAISAEILENYKYKKVIQGYQTITSMSVFKNEDEAQAEEKTDHSELMVKPGESLNSWVERTKLYPSLFRVYGGSKDGKPKRSRGRPKKGEQWYDKPKEVENVEEVPIGHIQ